MILSLTSNQKNENSITNPNTGIGNLIVYTILLIGIPLILIMTIKAKKGTKLMMLIGTVLLIPLTVSAICKEEITVESKIQIDGREAVFLPGKEVNIKMKQLAGNNTSTDNESTEDTNIKAIRYSSVEPNTSNKETKNIVSPQESPYPIYMWYDNGTIYWWSEDKTPSLNINASHMFRRLTSLTDISGLETADVSKVKEIAYIFASDTSISDLKALKKWIHHMLQI